MNSYVILDTSNVVLNVVEMPDEPVPQDLLDAVLNAGNGSRLLRVSSDTNELSSVETVTPVNNPSIGFRWDGIGFVSSSPGPEFMLDHTGYNWVAIPPSIDTPGTYSWDSENRVWIPQ